MTELSAAGPAPPPPPGVRHEPGDENYRTILTTAAILAGVIIVVYFAMWWMLQYFQHRETVEKRGEFPLAVQENQLPLSERVQQLDRAQPLLEGFKRQEGYHVDVRPSEMRSDVQQRLKTYGPAEPREPGYARVPIDVAMRHMLEKNRLPVQEKSGTTKKGKEPKP